MPLPILGREYTSNIASVLCAICYDRYLLRPTNTPIYSFDPVRDLKRHQPGSGSPLLPLLPPGICRSSSVASMTPADTFEDMDALLGSARGDMRTYHAAKCTRGPLPAPAGDRRPHR
jgi:hypothetical protein